MTNHRKKGIILFFIWLLEGIVIGFGAILPGISGGTLCVAFGMYRPVIETLSNFKSGIKKHGFMLGVFLIGVAAGFIGLSGFAAWLMERNTVLVTCAFVGFIIGTFPELWRDAGSQGRGRASYISILVCFVVMFCILLLLKSSSEITVRPDIFGYLLCGVLWGFSFIIPGLSSSSLLLFFGLYQPMLNGISRLAFDVLIPMAVGMLLCVLLLSKVIGAAYKKHYSIVSHGVIGIIAATVLLILPEWNGSLQGGILYVLCILGGAAISYGFTCVCNKIKETTK